MAVSNEFLDYVLDLLTTIGPVKAKRLFGGAMLYNRVCSNVVPILIDKA
jgi:TfoX/Sxy family transcriptional regulator of competence genes